VSRSRHSFVNSKEQKEKYCFFFPQRQQNNMKAKALDFLYRKARKKYRNTSFFARRYINDRRSKRNED
jgi:hypothetical protein